MNAKKVSRIKRARKARFKLRELGADRLCVNRTPRHIYVQLISGENGNILASASSVEKEFKSEASTGNIAAAEKVGVLIAERAKKAGVTKVSFDRSGYKYHGRIKALADAARGNGLDF